MGVYNDCTRTKYVTREIIFAKLKETVFLTDSKSVEELYIEVPVGSTKSERMEILLKTLQIKEKCDTLAGFKEIDYEHLGTVYRKMKVSLTTFATIGESVSNSKEEENE